MKVIYNDNTTESLDYKSEIRPLRNANLIKTFPRDESLRHCDRIEISNLGELFVMKLISNNNYSD